MKLVQMNRAHTFGQRLVMPDHMAADVERKGEGRIIADPHFRPDGFPGLPPAIPTRRDKSSRVRVGDAANDNTGAANDHSRPGRMINGDR